MKRFGAAGVEDAVSSICMAFDKLALEQDIMSGFLETFLEDKNVPLLSQQDAHVTNSLPAGGIPMMNTEIEPLHIDYDRKPAEPESMDVQGVFNSVYNRDAEYNRLFAREINELAQQGPSIDCISEVLLWHGISGELRLHAFFTSG